MVEKFTAGKRQPREMEEYYRCVDMVPAGKRQPKEMEAKEGPEPTPQPQSPGATPASDQTPVETPVETPETPETPATPKTQETHETQGQPAQPEYCPIPQQPAQPEYCPIPEVGETAGVDEALRAPSSEVSQWCHLAEGSVDGGYGALQGFEAGTGPLLLLGLLLQLLQLLLLLLPQLLGSHPRYPSEERAPASGYECGFSPFAAISSSSLVVFRQLAVYFVVFEAELIFLYPWSAALLPSSLLGSALGYYGVLPFLACLVVGFGLEIKRDALKL